MLKKIVTVMAAGLLAVITGRGRLGPGFTSAKIGSIIAAASALIGLAAGKKLAAIFFGPATIYVARASASLDELLRKEQQSR